MFAHLEKFKDEGFGNDHRTITFNTLTDKQEYEVVAVFRTVVYTDSPDAFKYYRFVDAESAGEFDDFIGKCKELSFYDTGVTAEYGDKLITLSTCCLLYTSSVWAVPLLLLPARLSAEVQGRTTESRKSSLSFQRGSDEDR